MTSIGTVLLTHMFSLVQSRLTRDIRMCKYSNNDPLHDDGFYSRLSLLLLTITTTTTSNADGLLSSQRLDRLGAVNITVSGGRWPGGQGRWRAVLVVVRQIEEYSSLARRHNAPHTGNAT